MLCRKCNAIIPEDSVFCPECGDPVQEEVPELAKTEETVETTKDEEDVLEEVKENACEEYVSAEAKKETSSKVSGTNKEGSAKKGKSVYNYIGIAVGIICILYGVLVFVGATNNLDSASFGGDFYTYTYDGIYVIAGLMTHLTRVCSMLLIGFGAFMTCYFASRKAK